MDFAVAVALLIMFATLPVFGQMGFAAGPKGGLAVPAFRVMIWMKFNLN
jgi:hypothetical protein